MGGVKWAARVCAVLVALGSASAAADPVQIAPNSWPFVRRVDERFQSYNVEMAEVIGGSFWKPYSQLGEIPQLSQGDSGGAVGLNAELFSQRPPVDLSNNRLRVLAAALGPAYVRVSGSWANTVYFQDNEEAPLSSPPEGYRGVLTRTQWRGVVDFARAVDARLVISYAVNAAVRDADGTWTPVQARPFMDFNRAIGSDIYAAELFNEPNLSSHAGGPPDYDGPAFARDIAAFRAFTAQAAPNMLIVGPGDSPGLAQAEEYLSSEPQPRFDVFDYHFYPAVSQRCAPPDSPLMGVTPERAMTESYLQLTDRAFAVHKPLRDRYAPNTQIWITETAGAACGGAPWSATFLDTFRYLDQMGRLAKQGVDVIFHNTLAAGEYALIDEFTHEPRPNYWAALLWRRLMSETVLDAGANTTDLHLYAHCLRDQPGGVALLAINLGDEREVVATSSAAQVYALTAGELQSHSVRLNGRTLNMRSNDRLPELRPRRARAGNINIAGHSIVFIAMPGANNSSCQ